MNTSLPVKLLLIAALGCFCLSTTASATTVKSLYAGSMSSYAVDTNGTLWVWGSFLGQNYLQPTSLSLIDHVASVFDGCGGVVVLKDDGTVWACGSLVGYQTGTYPGQNSTVPVRINISGVTYIDGTACSIYMVKSDGSLWMCGNELCLSFDDLSNATYCLEPVQLPIGNVSRVIVTQSFVYAQKDDGSWWAWGENRDGQLDDRTTTSRMSPAKILLDNVTMVSTSATCYGVNDVYITRGDVLALTGDSKVYGWGNNVYSVSGDGQFPAYAGQGDDSGYVVASPHPVPGLGSVADIGCGDDYYVVVKKDGTVWSWGCNPGCTEGRSTLDSRTPVQLPGFSGIVSVIPGSQHFLAIKRDGTVWAWGFNMNGQLGCGEISTFGGKPYAVQVKDLYVDLPLETGAPASSTSAPTPGFSALATLCGLIATACLFFRFASRT